MRRAANAVTGIYDRALAPINLSINQYTLLINISRLGTCSVSQLATYIGLERTTLVRTLKPLFELGYLVDQSAAGQRNRRIQLTPSGTQLMEQGTQLWATAQTAMEQTMGRDTLAQLLEILSRLPE